MLQQGGSRTPCSLQNRALLTTSLCLQLYFRLLQDNLELKEKLQETELLLSQNKVELERLRQVGLLRDPVSTGRVSFSG